MSSKMVRIYKMSNGFVVGINTLRVTRRHNRPFDIRARPFGVEMPVCRQFRENADRRLLRNNYEADFGLN